MRSLVLILSAVALLENASAQQKASLEDYQKSLLQQEQVLLIQYGKDLESTMTALKQKGDLDNFLVFDAERKRFETEQTVPDPLYVFDAFRPTVETYHKSTVSLLKKYVTALDGLMQKLMVANRIEDAKSVKKEKEATLARIARIESKLPQTDPFTSDEATPPNLSDPGKTPGSTPSGRKPIPEDAVEFKGHHYKLFTDGASWDKAAFRCRTLGGHLVVISDSAENDFVYNLMRGQMVVWIGASKDMGTWRWCTPTRFKYQNWAPGQPDSGKAMGFKAAICGDWPSSSEVRGRWDDRPEESTLRNEAPNNQRGSRNFSGVSDRYGDNYDVTGYVCEWDY